MKIQKLDNSLKIGKMKIDNYFVSIMIIALLGLGVYFNSLSNDFVWEDFELILNNRVVQNLSNWPAYFTGGSFSRGSANQLFGIYYRPALTFFYALMYAVAGAKPFFYHFSSVLIHIACVLVGFTIFKKLINGKIAFFLSLIFLVHPMNTESVSYPSSIYNMLFMLSGLVALNVFINSFTEQKIKITKLFLIGSLLLLSVLFKETGILFVPTIILLAWFKGKTHLLSISVTGVIATSIYFAMRFGIGKIPIAAGGVSPILNAPILTKLMTIPAIIFYYIKTFFFPLKIVLPQHWIVQDFGVFNFFIPLLIDVVFLLAIIAFGMSLKKNHPEDFSTFLFFAGWFAGGVLIHLPIFPIDMTVANRWFYFPMIGLLGILGVWVKNFKVEVERKRILFILILIVLLAMSIRTIVRNMDWKNNLTLASYDVKHSEGNFEIENLYGIEIAKSGKIDEGELHLKKSIELLPYGSNLVNLGSIYVAKKDYPSAINYFQKATKYNDYKAWENLASMLYFHGDPVEAKEKTEEAISYFPTNPKLWYILYLIEKKLGNEKEMATAVKTYNSLVRK